MTYSAPIRSGIDGPQALHQGKISLVELDCRCEFATIATARELLLEYGRFVQAQVGVASFCFGALEQEAAQLPRSYLAQGGGAALTRVGEFPAGFVAWRSLGAPELSDAWELKRLWTRPEARGYGLGRVLVQAVVDRARAAGKTRLVLDTAPQAMAAAHRLYVAMGFTACPAYSGQVAEGLLCMSKFLGKP